MRIVQLIDSLETGGAERMAVNYANALYSKIEFSGLVATRNEGALKEQLDPKVSYLFLNKKKTIDLKVIRKFYNYCKQNKIEYIHAHSSSYFLAVLVKIALLKIKIIWHIHNGSVMNDSKINFFMTRFFAPYFNYILSVNKDINNWVLEHNLCKNSIYLENFSLTETDFLKETVLKGEKKCRILQLANLKKPKNHIFTIKVAKQVISKHQDCSFHLVGKDFNDAYSNELKEEIKKGKLENHIFIYGSKNDTDYIISQADICILTSNSEGLPVALIEYGMYKKPVVCTNVGEIPNIIKKSKNGFLTNTNDTQKFVENLILLIEDPVLRNTMGNNLYQTVYEGYSEKKVIEKYIALLQN
jgi:glycosyltransferase involved in cell wall biosynthesis